MTRTVLPNGWSVIRMDDDESLAPDPRIDIELCPKELKRTANVAKTVLDSGVANWDLAKLGDVHYIGLRHAPQLDDALGLYLLARLHQESIDQSYFWQQLAIYTGDSRQGIWLESDVALSKTLPAMFSAITSELLHGTAPDLEGWVETVFLMFDHLVEGLRNGQRLRDDPGFDQRIEFTL